MKSWEKDPNLAALNAWEANASFWNERMGEGNDFVNILEWPAIERLLDIQAGERVLDAACGNGLTSRRLAASGAEVTAFDFSPNMITCATERTAKERTQSTPGSIDYYVLDATDEAALVRLGESSFDAALCNMAMFDMAEIDPLLRAIYHLLRPGGRIRFLDRASMLQQFHYGANG